MPRQAPRWLVTLLLSSCLNVFIANFIVYKNGVELIRVDGAPKEKNDLVTWIDNLIGFTSY